MKTLRFSYHIFVLFAIFVGAGCSFHNSNLTETLVEVPSTYSEVKDKGTQAPPVGKWWKQFGDEKLDTLMEEAFRHNPDIAQAYERLKQFQAIIRTTNSSRGLNINLEGSGGRTRQSGTFGTITEDIYTLSAGASYELDLWKKIGSETRAARFDALALEEDLNAMYISISAQLADLYYLSVEQQAQLYLSDQTIASFQDTLERVERRYREGLVPAIDVYRSRQNLAAARAQRPLFEANLSVTLNALSVLAGRFPDKETAGNVKELSDPPMFPVGIPSQLLERRPDIKAALMRLKASDERAAAAIADRFPSFNLIGSYGGASEKIRTVLDSPNIFWNILLQAAQPVLDAGRRKAEVDRAKAVFEENLYSFHKTILNAFKEVEDALAQGSASEERIKMLNESAAASESAVRLALDRYMQGLTDYLPVLTEQLRLFSAKSNLLTEKRKLISSRIQLVRALGGEWTDESIKRF